MIYVRQCSCRNFASALVNSIVAGAMYWSYLATSCKDDLFRVPWLDRRAVVRFGTAFVSALVSVFMLFAAGVMSKTFTESAALYQDAENLHAARSEDILILHASDVEDQPL